MVRFRSALGLALMMPLACSLLADTEGLETRATPDGSLVDASVDETSASDDAAEAGATDAPSAVDGAADGNPAFPIDAAPDASANAAYRAAVLVDSPTSYFRLEETSGTGCADEKAVLACAISPSNVTRGVPGIAGGIGARLTSTTATITSPPKSGNLGLPYTIEMWVAVDATSLGNGQRIFTLDESFPSRSGTAAFVFSAKEFRTETWSQAAFISYTLTSTAIAPSVWHHVVHGYNPTTDTDFTYFDGVLSSGGVDQSDAAPRPVVSNAMVVSGWTGSVDEIALYDKVLSPARILAHYALR